MHIEVVQNSEQPLGDLMRDQLADADQFSAASAFLNSNGLQYVLPNMQRILENEGSVSIVHGADFRITDPSAIERLVALNEQYAKMTYKIQYGWDLTQSHRFHPKLYLWTSDYRSYTAVVGSSNLTYGGLYSNLEVNTIIRGDIPDSAISQCLNIFDGIIAHPTSVTPNREFVDKYEQLYSSARELPHHETLPDDLQELYRELAELLISPPVDWQPRNQLEFVVKALQILEGNRPDPNLLQDDGGSFIHLRAIYDEFIRLARAANKNYDWSAVETSVRGRINENVRNPSIGGSYFVRAGGMSGRYRLSEAGWRLVREREQQANVRNLE